CVSSAATDRIRKAERRQVALEVGGQTHRTGLDLSTRRNPSAPSGLHGPTAQARKRRKDKIWPVSRPWATRKAIIALGDNGAAVRWVGGSRPSEMVYLSQDADEA